MWKETNDDIVEEMVKRLVRFPNECTRIYLIHVPSYLVSTTKELLTSEIVAMAVSTSLRLLGLLLGSSKSRSALLLSYTRETGVKDDDRFGRTSGLTST